MLITILQPKLNFQFNNYPIWSTNATSGDPGKKIQPNFGCRCNIIITIVYISVLFDLDNQKIDEATAV